jgi:triphosphoribosyl-dephospho-CoA synthetase
MLSQMCVIEEFAQLVVTQPEHWAAARVEICAALVRWVGEQKQPQRPQATMRGVVVLLVWLRLVQGLSAWLAQAYGRHQVHPC